MILPVYSVNGNKKHLLLVLPYTEYGQKKFEVVNGSFYLHQINDKLYIPMTNLLVSFEGYICCNSDYRGIDYDDALFRFESGERAIEERCLCCKITTWVDKKV